MKFLRCQFMLLLFLYKIYKASTASTASNKFGELKQCIGKHQIPLRDLKHFVLAREIAEPIDLKNFNIPPEETILENNDYTLVIKLKYSYNRTSVPTINFGPSSGLGTYRFEFLYFQSHPNSSTILPLELHAVFYNTENKKFQNALNRKNNVVVLAFGLQEKNPSTNKYAVLRKNIESVRIGLTKISIENRPLDCWLPASMEGYIMYEGYLPFLNCEAQVLWVDFVTTIAVEPDLVSEFGLLETKEGQPLMKQHKQFLAPSGPLVAGYSSDDREDPLGSIPFVDAFYDGDDEENVVFNGAFKMLTDIRKVGVFTILFEFYYAFV